MAKRERDRDGAKRPDTAGDGGPAGGRDRTRRRSRRDDDATASRAITRRRFVALLAAGAGAALSAPARAAAPSKGKPAHPAGSGTTPAAASLPPKVAKGLDEQRASLAKTLKTIRDFELPPGSGQGFAFRPLPARRKP